MSGRVCYSFFLPSREDSFYYAIPSMRTLWHDPTIRQMLARRKLRLEDSAGFFLDDVDRIAALDYSPSDDDVVRARLRTMGVQEYRFVFDKGSEAGQEWLMYDVGGTRTLRQVRFQHFWLSALFADQNCEGLGQPL